MKLAVVAGSIGIGFLLLALGGLWTTLFRAEVSWTEEKALRSVEVQTRLSNLGPIVNSTKPRIHAGPDPGTLKAEFDALQKENEQLNADFESATNRPRTTAKILKWSGISLAIVGLLGWYVFRQAS